MTDGEQHLCEWKYDMSGGFMTALFELIARADNVNRWKLAQGFPEEVAAFVRYAEVEGYWQKLQRELITLWPVLTKKIRRELGDDEPKKEDKG